MYHRHSVHPPVTSCYIHMTSPHPSIIVPTTSLQTAGITVRTSEWFRAKDRTAEGEDSDLRQRNFGWRISILWSRGCRKIDVFHCRCVPGLVMTNSSPWYRRPIEIDDLPNLIAWWFSMAMLNNQMVHDFTSVASGLGPWDLQETTLPGFFLAKKCRTSWTGFKHPNHIWNIAKIRCLLVLSREFSGMIHNNYQ